MSQAARVKRWQRVLDCIEGSIIAGLGVVMFYSFLVHPRHHVVPTLTWSVLLGLSGAAIVVGAVLRTVEPGHRQSVGFQFELCGWGGAASLILWYALIHFSHHGGLALLLALLLSVTMLMGAEFRLVAAMREGHRRVRGFR